MHPSLHGCWGHVAHPTTPLYCVRCRVAERLSSKRFAWLWGETTVGCETAFSADRPWERVAAGNPCLDAPPRFSRSLAALHTGGLQPLTRLVAAAPPSVRRMSPETDYPLRNGSPRSVKH